MTSLGSDVLALGALFHERLPAAILATALDYVQFNEAGLALEILAEQLVEYDVKISTDEFERFRALASFMYPDDAPVLSQLVGRVVA